MEKNESHKVHSISILFLAILLIFGILISLNGVNGANHTVDTNGNLGNVIDTVASGDNIIINGGTYSSANNITNLNISKNMNIYGAKYLGRSNADTILDGGNSARFFNIANGVTVNIYGIKFQNGVSDTDGGAISSVGGTCNLRNVSFTNCRSSLPLGFGSVNGGAVSAVNSNGWSFVTTNFINCSSRGFGGAVYFVGGSFNFIYCEFINNSGTGGAIYTNSSNGNISYSLLLNNKFNDSSTNQIFNSGTGKIIANNNYWGANFPLYQVNNVTVDNWYIIFFNGTSSNIIGDKLKFSYNLLLYNGKDFVHDPNVSKLPYFQVTLKHDGVVIGTLDGRKSYSNTWNTIVKSANKLDAFYANLLIANTNFNGQLKTKITPIKTKFTGKFGKNVTLKATLKDINGKKLSGKMIGLFINGKIVGLNTTNSKGVVTFKHRIIQTGNLKVRFLHISDGNYTNATGNSKLVVKKHSMLLLNNTMKKSGRAAKLTSIIRNFGPNKLNAKVTYKLAKGVKAVKISKKLGKVSYNKKKGILTFNLSKFAKSSKKLAKLVVTFNQPLYNKRYFTNKVTSKNTLDVYNTMK